MSVLDLTNEVLLIGSWETLAPMEKPETADSQLIKGDLYGEEEGDCPVPDKVSMHTAFPHLLRPADSRVGGPVEGREVIDRTPCPENLQLLGKQHANCC